MKEAYRPRQAISFCYIHPRSTSLVRPSIGCVGALAQTTRTHLRIVFEPQPARRLHSPHDRSIPREERAWARKPRQE
jgi:hypothetical protein